MRESEIDKRFKQHDKDVKLYIDMKARAWKSANAIGLWVNKHPWKALLMLFIFIGLSFFIYFSAVILITGVDVKETIETKTGIKFKDADIQ